MTEVLGVLDPKEQVIALGEQLILEHFHDRKFSVEDVTPEWHQAVEMWVYGLTYQNFLFLDDIARKCRRAHDVDNKQFGECLTVNQAKGALNCWRAQVVRAHERHSEAQDENTNSGPDLTEIPVGKKGKGYYAVHDGEKMRFFRVDKPKEGRWSDWVFVKEQHGGNFEKAGAQKPGTRYKGLAGPLIAYIADHAEQSARLYGTELGRCCRCGRELTDETSRRLGIGPECRKEG